MIKTEQLTFEYPAYDDNAPPQPVLNGIDISITHGEFVAILGHNGSGKSTLARHFNALLLPKNGTVWINGKDTKDPDNIWSIRQSTGMLFQNPDNQIVATTVEEDVAFGPENLGVPSEEIRKRVGDCLHKVGMTDYAKSPPHNLSGGQKQRVAIAGVLAMQPGCIVLDEPTAMLDPSGRREVLETVMRMNRDMGVTVVLITHFMEEAALANRIVVLEAGKVVMDDTPRQVFSQVGKMQELGLGVPQITALAYDLKKHGTPIDTVLTVDEFLGQIHPTNYGERSKSLPCSLLPSNHSTNTETIIQIQDLTHTYNPNSVFQKTALDNISLTINRNQLIAIIGHTGSGKSTLIQQLNALLKPTSGKVYINDKDLSDKSNLKTIRQQVGLVFQYPEHQLFETTVYKDVSFGPLRLNLPQEEVDSRVRTALSIVGIDESLYEKSPFELSGGQKRRVAIAGVLAMRPDILILDEPAAGLDPAGKDEILSQIKHMHKTLGLTVILVSHSMDDAARLSDKIFVMNQGKIKCQGTPSEVFAQGEMLKSIGLDVPQISRLFTELHKTYPHIPAGVFTISDAVNILCKGNHTCQK